MDSTEVIAIAGIVGTIAGTAIGAVIAAWTASQVEKRREKREEEAEARKARAAARMIRSDLVVSAATLNWTLERGVWDPGRAYLPIENWRRHGENLALALDDGAAWNRIELAMAGGVQHLVEIKNDIPPGALTPTSRENLAKVHAMLMNAERSLAPLAGDPQAQHATDATK